MRIGLLGGSFNPAHEGHLHISMEAIKRLHLHKLWWLITPGNPLKSATSLAPLQERFAQALLLARHPKIEVTAFEAGLPSPYACDTLGFLRQRHPAVHFVWIMGGDNLAQFHKWRNWTEIFASIPIFIADRPTFRYPALASPAARRFAGAYVQESRLGRLAVSAPPVWSYVSLPLCHSSSTAIRSAAKTEKFPKN
jgi:nicotinate-nucleotide adenylyltransferase